MFENGDVNTLWTYNEQKNSTIHEFKMFTTSFFSLYQIKHPQTLRSEPSSPLSNHFVNYLPLLLTRYSLTHHPLLQKKKKKKKKIHPIPIITQNLGINPHFPISYLAAVLNPTQTSTFFTSAGTPQKEEVENPIAVVQHRNLRIQGFKSKFPAFFFVVGRMEGTLLAFFIYAGIWYFGGCVYARCYVRIEYISL